MLTKSGAIALFCVQAIALVAAEPPTLRLEKTIPLAGVRGRIDHFAVDLEGSRPFVAALGNNTVETMPVPRRAIEARRFGPSRCGSQREP